MGMQRWHKRLAVLLYAASVATLALLSITAISTTRNIASACDYFEPPKGSVIDESDEHTPRGEVKVLPFALHCSYASSHGDKTVVVHDLGTAPLLISLAIVFIAPIAWGSRRRGAVVPSDGQHASEA